MARKRALQSVLASFALDASPAASAVRQEFAAHLRPERVRELPEEGAPDPVPSRHVDLHGRALQAARQTVLAMRANDEIGDDAFHRVEEELDWLEMGEGRRSDRTREGNLQDR